MTRDRETEEPRNQASIEKAIIKTLVYRDLFDYPLRAEEIWRFLIEKKATKTVVGGALARLESRRAIGRKENFYFLPGRKGIVSLRRKREAISVGKVQRVRRYVALLHLIPWVQAVFVTGAVAAGNAEEQDDLDILVIASPKRLWLTRLLVFLALVFLGVKRSAGAKVASSKICPNMFFVTTALKLPKNEQNMYTAYEIAQAKPLWERGPVHQLFLAENGWVKGFLPNWWEKSQDTRYKDIEKLGKPRASLFSSLFAPILDFLEEIVYKLQLAYMAKRRTRETVTRERILFHSQDLPSRVLGSYRKGLGEVLAKWKGSS